MARKPPRTKTITSRSLTLTTSNFCFDFTWRKVEVEESEQSPLRGGIKPSPPPESFAQLLQRKQITQLIAPIGEGAPPSHPLPVALGPLAHPSSAQVCRTYRQVSLLDAGQDDDDYV